jgi:hypothetical protein
MGSVHRPVKPLRTTASVANPQQLIAFLLPGYRRSEHVII